MRQTNWSEEGREIKTMKDKWKFVWKEYMNK